MTRLRMLGWRLLGLVRRSRMERKMNEEILSVKEHQREARMFRWLAGWPMDLKLGGRMLVKYPGLTIVGGMAMAFAIWAGIVIFQVVGLFTNPTLPVSEGARLVEIRSIDVAANVQEEKVLYDFLE